MRSATSEAVLEQRLAVRGEEMNLDIVSDQERLYRAFGGSDYLAIAIANAFTWTGHAARQEDFFKAAIDYLTTGRVALLETVAVSSGRFGAEGLLAGLRAWRTILHELGDNNAQSCRAAGLRGLQERSLDIAFRLKSRGEISGLGPWLFCAPFKIVAAHRRSLWCSKGLDEVRMPLGLEVVRGIRKYKQKGGICAEGFDINMLSETEGDLREGMGTVELVHGLSREVAGVSRTRVVHINSGFYLYGKDEL